MWTTTSYYSYSPTAIATFKFSSLLPQIIEEEGKPFLFYFFCYYTFHKPPYNFMWVCSMKNYISDSVRFILGSSTITIHKKKLFLSIAAVWFIHFYRIYLCIYYIYIWVESWPMFLLDSSSASEGYSRFFFIHPKPRNKNRNM